MAVRGRKFAVGKEHEKNVPCMNRCKGVQKKSTNSFRECGASVVEKNEAQSTGRQADVDRQTDRQPNRQTSGCMCLHGIRNGVQREQFHTERTACAQKSIIL